MNRKFSRLALSCGCLFSFLSFQEAVSLVKYETYLESWDGNSTTGWGSAMRGLPIPSGASKYQSMTVDIAFADYKFAPTTCQISGVDFYDSANNIGDVIAYVHAAGGEVKISFGGANPAYFISNPSNPNNLFTATSALATAVAEVINASYPSTSSGSQQFDGVDFDVEDSLPSGKTAASMAAAITSFLTYLKPLIPGKSISLTIPGQGWNTYWQTLAQNAASGNLVDYINFMEYDIWINSPTTNYVTQIVADLQTYTGAIGTSPGPNAAPGWGLPASIVQLGLMPQNDDNGNDLTLAYAQSLTQMIITPGGVVPGLTFYPGIMTWDLDRDAQEATHDPVTNPPYTPYSYTNAIRAETPLTETISTQSRRNQNSRQATVTQPFVRQPVPPHSNLNYP